MLKAWSPTKPLQRGFSPVEVILAASIFAFLVTALIGAIIYGRASTASSGERARAAALAEEGVEAVRNIRDAAFSNLTAGTYGLVQSGGIWTLSGSQDVTGNFTRQITIADVDSTRKTVTATVTWPQGTGTGSTSASLRLTNWMATISGGVTPGPIMMVYSKNTTTPFYRIWQGLNWSGEGSANVVVGNINHMVVKSSRTRNEAILGVQTSTGAIYVQVWNGGTQTWGAATQVGTGPTTTRSFDIAYEKNGDRAIIAFTPSSGSADFAYRTWNGTTLSTATTITTPPTTGAINWIEVEQNPLSSSNEVALIMLDANADTYGMAWNGTTWGTMGVATVWDATSSTATKKGIDVAYEQTSGEAMFMFGDSVATDQYFRTWNGTTLTGPTLLDIAAEGGIPEWLTLAARPSSNEIMLGVQDAGADLNTRKWSGSAWDAAHTEHSAAVENITSKVFDIVWETHPTNAGEAWLLWGDSATVTAKPWSTIWSAGSVLSLSDDTSFIDLLADPSSGAVFAGLYEDSTSGTDDIWETHLTGGGSSWNTKSIMWGGPTTATPVHTRVDMSAP